MRDSAWRFPRPQELSRRGFLSLGSGLAAVGLLGVYGPTRVEGLTGLIQEPADLAALTPFERAHLPVINMPPFTENGSHVPLTVEMAHPMEPDHHIKSLRIFNEQDPVPSKGIFHFTPANGEAYLAVQARMHSGSSSVTVIAECSQHGLWSRRQAITIPQFGGGCAAVVEREPRDQEIRSPVIRIPERVRAGGIRRGDLIRVQIKVKHPSRTGLAFRNGRFIQESPPFFLREMEIFYGGDRVSRYEMTSALSDNPFITFKLRATIAAPIRVVLTNSRNRRFEAVDTLAFS
jgi:desulfoferrodoxin (superoxide reductase-like protein)